MGGVRRRPHACAASHPRAVPGPVRGAAFGLRAAAAVALAIWWHALWVQFHGPLTEHYASQGPWHADLRWFVLPPGDLLFHTSASAAFVATQLGLPEMVAYLGWPLLAVLVAAAICFWRDHRVRAAAVTSAILELISFGGGAPKTAVSGSQYGCCPTTGSKGLPVTGELLPTRFCILADGAAATLLAFTLDRARSAAQQLGKWRWRHGSIPTLATLIAALSLIPLPYHPVPVTPVPAGWQTAFAGLRLAPDDRVLVVPIPVVGNARAMRWQAETGEPGSLIGG
jgi:hypothetical protein